MQKRVIQIVMDSFGSQFYSKAMECLKVLREESVKVRAAVKPFLAIHWMLEIILWHFLWLLSLQGSHRALENLKKKTGKNETTFASQGKVREFWKNVKRSVREY